MNNLKNRFVAILFIFTTLSCQVVGKYQWHASFETHFTDKKSKKEITVTNTFSDPSKLPILVKRTYSDDRPVEYFLLKTFEHEEVIKIAQNNENIKELQENYFLEGDKYLAEMIKKIMIRSPKPKSLGIFYLKKGKEKDKIDPVMLGAVSENGTPFQELSETNTAIPHTEEEVDMWVCANSYIEQETKRTIQGIYDTTLSLFFQNYIHKKNLEKVRGQMTAEKKTLENEKMTAIKAIFKEKAQEKKVWLRKNEYIGVNCYEGIFEKLEEDDSLGEIPLAYRKFLYKSYKTEFVVGSICMVCISLGLYALEKIYMHKKKRKSVRKKYQRK